MIFYTGIRRKKNSLTKDELEMLEFLDGTPLKKFPLKPVNISYYKQFQRRGLVSIGYGKGVNAYNNWVTPTGEGWRLLREHRERKAAAKEKRRADAAARRALEKLRKATLDE